MHASVKSPQVYSLLQKGTSVSNWQNSGFIMGDSNEQNHFVIHSAGDYKLIRNPSPTLFSQICLAFPVPCGFFSLISEQVLNLFGLTCHNKWTNPPLPRHLSHISGIHTLPFPLCPGLGVQGNSWGFYCSQLVPQEAPCIWDSLDVPIMCKIFLLRWGQFDRSDSEGRKGSSCWGWGWGIWGDALPHSALWWWIPQHPLIWAANKISW